MGAGAAYGRVDAITVVRGDYKTRCSPGSYRLHAVGANAATAAAAGGDAIGGRRWLALETTSQ